MSSNNTNSILVSEEVRRVLKKMVAHADANKLKYITSDSLVYGLCFDDSFKQMLEHFDVESQEFQSELEEFLSENNEQRQSQQELIKSTQIDIVVNYAGNLAFNRGDNKIEIKDLILALIDLEEDSFSFNYLTEKNINSLKVKQYFAHEVPLKAQAEAGSDNKEYPALNKFGTNLSKKAGENLIDPVIGRNLEVTEIINVLAQRRKNNPLLVGDAGVGKTTIAEGLALKIKNGEVPSQLKDMTLYSIEVGSLLAGAKFRGDLEERLQQVIKEAASDPNIVLFIDEIHQIIGSGNSSNNNMEAANILKPALASGKIKVIGATTFKEYREIFQKDAALERRFQKIDVEEPTAADTIDILKGLRSKFSQYHGIEYSDAALTAAVNLSIKFLADRKLPDKAIDLIDGAGARLKLRQKHKIVGEQDIAEMVAAISKIPVGNITSSDKSKLQNIDKKLKSVVFGQDTAVDELVNAIRVSRAGLAQNKNKPVGNFLFSGPTGTGKTEMAKQLAAEMGMPLLRFDMSEFMEKHNVARLVGAPPGYVGYNEGGKLTEMVKQKPYSIVLLDEIEKAHPDLFNILLQVMEDGRLTDGQGRTTDFKNTLIIMTTNLGASVINQKTIGFHQGRDVEADRSKAVKNAFAPEFYNRLDAVVAFKPLTKELISKITEKNLNTLSRDLTEKNVSAVFTPEAIAEISEKGFDAEMGARPLQRFINDKIIKPLSIELLHGKLEQGGDVIVDFKDDKFDFAISSYTNHLDDMVEEIVQVPRKRAKSLKS